MLIFYMPPFFLCLVHKLDFPNDIEIQKKIKLPNNMK